MFRQRRVTTMVVLLMFLVFFAMLYSVYTKFYSIALQQQHGNTQEWVFSDGTQLISNLEERSDGLVNWSLEIRCPNGDIQPATYGIGYSPEEYVSRFEITTPPILVMGYIVIQSSGQTFVRPTDCK